MAELDDGLFDSGMRREGRFNLAKLDAKASKLDLLIRAPAELDVAIRMITSLVAGLVNPTGPVATKRMRQKPFTGKVRPVEVFHGEAVTTNVQIAWHTDRHRLQVPIQNVALRVRNRPADRLDGISRLEDIGIELVNRGPDRRFGRTVHVPDGQRTFVLIARPASRAGFATAQRFQSRARQRNLQPAACAM